MPSSLPKSLPVVWQQPHINPGLAGVAATKQVVIVSGRDETDTLDLWTCYNAGSGEPLWSLPYPAIGDLDYGNSPRATPLIHKQQAFLLGAFGDLHCVNLRTGQIVWKRNLALDFDATRPTWGYTSSPLLADGLLIVNPGGKQASLVALEPATGKIVWQTPGRPAAYGAFVTATVSQRTQIIGYDETSLGGWDAKTGKRMWEVIPAESDDFNVPTPIVLPDGILVSTENNGTRIYRWKADGTLHPKPAARHAELAPDTTTPVVTNGRVFGNWEGRLFCLDVKNGLMEIWAHESDDFADYCSYLTDGNRVLIVTVRGEMYLLDAIADAFRVVSRLTLFDQRTEVYSHPAIVGNKLYVRDSHNITCFQLPAAKKNPSP